MKTKKIILMLVVMFAITFYGCYPLRGYDTSGFTGSGITIYYKNEEIAKLSNIEYSLDNGKLVKEMTFKLKNQNHADKVTNLLAYIHSKHKEWEIELDLPINDSLSISND